MRRFSFRPTLSLRGRTFKGLRGWAGKPFHPPLTDVPVAAYLLAAVFDVISVLGRHHSWARDFYRAATFTFVGGVVVSVFAALTGFWDWLRSSTAGTQARRTINTHAWTMITVTVLALADTGLRLFAYSDDLYPNGLLLVLSLATAGLVSLGALYGGALVYEYGFNVETAGDHPVWHVSEEDVFPGTR
jgi:uncharacterized membrane protein